jgi:hypothetical protein
MRQPDWNYTPTDHAPYYIEAGHPMVHIFNHEDATRNNYHGLDFKPFSAKRGPGERFDAVPSDPHGTIYIADSLGAGVHECLFPHAKREPGKRDLLARSQVVDQSYYICHSPERLTLVSLCDGNATAKFKAGLDIVQSKDVTETQKWARYIREKVSGTQGLAWMSQPAGAVGHSFVLFDDRMPSTVPRLRRYGPPIRFASPVGWRILKAICVEAGVYADWNA